MVEDNFIRVVFDTNVFLSALISKQGAPDLVYQAWRAGYFEVVTSYEQLEEIKRVSRYPKIKSLISSHLIGTLVNNLYRIHVLTHPSISIDLDDPEDVFLAAQAIQGRADYLITGDHRSGLLKLKTVGAARIVTPAEFCRILLH